MIDQKDTYLLTQVSKYDNQLKNVQDSSHLNSVAITKESIERINADTALNGRISDLSVRQIEDKAQLVAEIERHHEELGSAVETLGEAFINEQASRVTSEARINEAITQLGESLNDSLEGVGEELGGLSDYLDTTTTDSNELTVDSDEVSVAWSLLSASQEWRLEIAKHIAEAERNVTALIKSNEANVLQALGDSATALENSDINRVVQSLQGKVGLSLLDQSLAQQLIGTTTSVGETKAELQKLIQQQVAQLGSQFKDAQASLVKQIANESSDRVDALAHQAQRLETMIEANEGANISEELLTMWAESDKAQTAKIDRMVQELIPITAGNETLLAGDTTTPLGFEGVITQLADANAHTRWELDKLSQSFVSGTAQINASLSNLKLAVANYDGSLVRQVDELQATYQTQADALLALTATVSEDYITRADAQTALAGLESTFTSRVAAIKPDSTIIPDTREDDQPPSWYRENYAGRVVTEFKRIAIIGAASILTVGPYCTLTTTVSWADSSGGAIKQVAITGAEDAVAVRYSVGGKGAETWTDWIRQGAGTETTLSATIKETTKTLDGISALKTVTIDNNGVIAGYGLASAMVAGEITSAFGVDADQFYVGSPDTGKKVFSVVNGVTVINDAVIGSLSANKITAGTMHGDRITAGTLNANHLSTATMEAIALKAQNVTVLKNTSKPNGTRMVMLNGLLSVYDDNNVLRVKLGIW